MKLGWLAVLSLALTSITWAQENTTLVNIPGMGCVTTAGTDTFSAISYSYRTSPPTLNVYKPSDDCTTNLLAVLATGKMYVSLTLTEYDLSGTTASRVITLQNVGVYDGDYVGATINGGPTPYRETLQFQGSSITIQVGKRRGQTISSEIRWPEAARRAQKASRR